MSSSGPRNLPDRAEIVIIGGGIIGASVAYHLTKLGRTDVVLLEQGQLSGGTTWHAAGLLGQLRATESGTRLVQYSASLYESLEEETGLATGFKRCGGVTVARTPDRLLQLERTAATAEAYDLECELLSPAQARDRYPILEIDDLLGALWLPGDGTANPVDVTASLARGARMGGAAIFITLAASASYIAAPAAMRIALPAANPAIALTLSLGVTFPFNLTLGIPIYIAMAFLITG